MVTGNSSALPRLDGRRIPALAEAHQSFARERLIKRAACATMTNEPVGPWTSGLGQVSGGAAGGGLGGVGEAQLQQHLRDSGQRQPVLDQYADHVGLQRLG